MEYEDKERQTEWDNTKSTQTEWGKTKSTQTEWCMGKYSAFKTKKSPGVTSVQFGRKTWAYNSVSSQTNIEMIKSMNRFQLYMPVVNAVALTVNVKSSGIPFTYLSPGKLELEIRKPPYRNMLTTIGLTSSKCNITKKTYLNRNWQGQSLIVACLTYTDDQWKFQKNWKCVFMKTGENVIKFDNGPAFQVTITECRRPDVRYTSFPCISKEEAEYIERRKAAVAKFSNMEISPDKIPITAIIGSGGGMRAVIGMGAALAQLKKQRILDRTMYVAGLSGSSWYLTALYASDTDFDPEKINSLIRTALNDFSGLKYWIVWILLKYFSSFNPENNFSVTSLFGEMIGRTLLPKKWKNKWSDQTERLSKGDVPLPLMSVLHCRDEKTIEEHHEWMEFSPYEVFIPRYGVAIDMKHFGDRFYRGYRLEENGEPSIGFLQGVCGSAYAIGRNYKPLDTKWYMCGRILKNCIRALFRIFDRMFIAKVPNFLLGIQLSKQNVVDKDSEADANTDYSNQEMMLVDAGLSFNSPYPSVLHPDRKVDFILSFDFSDRGTDTNWPFEELEKAQRWARQRNIPFPELKLDDIRIDWDNRIRKPVYVFPGVPGPTIVHILMVDECFTGEDYDPKFDLLQEYRTLRFGYGTAEYDKFNNKVQNIIERHKTKIHDGLINIEDSMRNGWVQNKHYM